MNQPTNMGLLAQARQGDIQEQARYARLAREARHHTVHRESAQVRVGHRRLVAAAASFLLALLMTAGVALANEPAAPAGGSGGGCGSTVRIVAC